MRIPSRARPVFGFRPRRIEVYKGHEPAATAGRRGKRMAGNGIETRINYVVRGEKAVFCAADRDASYWPQDPHPVRIEDVRPIAGQLSFDRNGFVLLNEPTAVADFTAKAEVEGIYVPEIIDLVKRLTGAEKVITFGTVIRSDAPDMADGGLPAHGAHVDYGDFTVRETARDILGAEADQWLDRRYTLINLWRPIRTVERTPLALCDASTVFAEDMFDSEVRGGLGDANRPSLWGYNLAYNPGHRWYYAPQMRPDEIYAFKLFDSDRSRIQWTAHTAFEDPTAAADAKPRQSIEIRTISFMPEGA
jgi:hypothetical protein